MKSPKMPAKESPLQRARGYVAMECEARNAVVYGQAAAALVARAFGTRSAEAKDFAAWQKEGRRLAGELCELAKTRANFFTPWSLVQEGIYQTAKRATNAHYGLHSYEGFGA